MKWKSACFIGLVTLAAGLGTGCEGPYAMNQPSPTAYPAATAYYPGYILSTPPPLVSTTKENYYYDWSEVPQPVQNYSQHDVQRQW